VVTTAAVGGAISPTLRRAGIAIVVVAVLVWRLSTVTVTPTVIVQAVLTGLLTGAVYGLVAMGLTLIFGVLEIVNFAHGALLTLGMYVGFLLVDRLGMNPYATLLIVVPALFVVGAVLQAGLLNRAMGQPLENQLLLTFGVAILIENGLLLTFGATPRTVGVTLGAPLRVLGAVATFPRIIAFVAALLLAALLYWALQRTKLGTAIRAVGQNAQGASLVGIDARRIYVLTFAVGASTVGAAAVLVLPFLQTEPTTGAAFTIIAFIVVVLGGLGNVTGALVGGLAIGLIQQLGGVLLPGQDSLMAVFIVFLLTLFLRPEGIFGGRAT
jgi:branched-chain amino acid transport system permease protein